MLLAYKITNCACQASVIIFAIITLWLLAQNKHHVRKWGYVIGIATQPFWVVIYWLSEQWLLMSLVIVYGGLYLVGFYNHWIRKGKN